VTEISTGLLNAMDRFGMTHLRKSASLPNSPRVSADQHEQHSLAWSADFEKDSTQSSRFQSSKEVLRKQFTYDFEAGESARMPSDSDEYRDGLSACNRVDLASSSRSEEDVNLPLCEPTSDFQALAAASAADASLFTFCDDEDYDSDEV